MTPPLILLSKMSGWPISWSSSWWHGKGGPVAHTTDGSINSVRTPEDHQQTSGEKQQIVVIAERWKGPYWLHDNENDADTGSDKWNKFQYGPHRGVTQIVNMVASLVALAMVWLSLRITLYFWADVVVTEGNCLTWTWNVAFQQKHLSELL